MSPPKRGDVVVCVLGVGAGLPASVGAHTDPAIATSQAATTHDAFAATAPADVVLLRPGCQVAAGWLEGLRDAAYASATVATAAALTQHDLDPPPQDLQHAAAAIRSASLRLRPRLTAAAAARAACLYVRRSALDLVGEGEAFWARAVERGLAHVLADDVLVLDPRPSPGRMRDRSAPQTRAIAAARRAVHGLAVTIDARILYGPTTGTHVHVLELIAALARAERARLTVIVPEEPSPHALARLQTLPRLSLVTYAGATSGADAVHRPFQLSNAGDLTFLQALGERVILTQQDLIAFHNPAYFPNPEAWEDYRQLTRLSLATADRVVFFSRHARDDALAEELVDPAHAAVVHLGADHHPVAAPTQPSGAQRLADDSPMILCLGSDFHHKNRLFALRLLECLKARHGWDGVLVFAGPSVPHGSSKPQEAQFLSAHPELSPAVLDLGPVTEAEKDWLFARAALVAYPSVVEGFGLVPFEAAAHRVPCLWAPGGSLSELIDDEAAGIVPWDADRTAEKALSLMRDAAARERHLNAIAGAGLTWKATATRLLEVYEATAEAPPRPRPAAGLSLAEDAARLVGPGGELPEDLHRPLLALATHRRIARPVFGAIKLGYRISSELGRRRHRRR